MNKIFLRKLNIGDEVLVKDEYDGNKKIINKTGTIVYNDGAYLIIFFHENIEGHDGFSEVSLSIRDALASRYITSVNNCWNFDINKCYNIIEPTKIDNMLKIKYELYEKAFA